jgi:hypothetical protein
VRLPLAALAIATVAIGCVPRAAKIPPKAAVDMQCPESSLTVMELSGGGEGPHLVQGCGKKATYELNPFGDWVLNDTVSVDPKYIKPESAEEK